MKFTATKTDGNLITYANPPDSANDTPEQSQSGLIAASAYYMAEARGFMPGHELDDWLKAEAEINARGEKS